ncbi:endoribonuclease L-PSP family protein [Asticcacaulis biprosthecium C19]|uniref:Endoribonuclease L-PSP family protein n=1 Tax=Asticcacaulis biprosthecium C19 TaxID=715226 RepID=F4QSS8_9CAUL|nr:endoribonuclease L-PSP family protein [Asticcacaulis biprosthecium C19]
MAAAPVANYVPFVRTGNLIHISGQVSNDGKGGLKGTVGADLSVDQGVEAARICGLNLLAQMKAAAGDLDNVVRVIKLNGFVQAGPDFYDIPQVINGCSDLMVAVLGDAGRHARSAVGMYKIPLGFAVEIDAVIEVLDRR